MGPKRVFWNTKSPGATAYLAASGQPHWGVEGGGWGENLLPEGKKHFSKEKFMLPLDVINGPV